MAVTVGNVATNTGTGTSITANNPSGVTNGTFLLAFVSGVNLGTGLTAPAGWTEVGLARIGSGGVGETRVFYRFWLTGDPTSHTWTGAVSGAWCGDCIALGNVDTTLPIELGAAARGGGTTVFGTTTTAPVLDVQSASGLLLTFFVEQGNKTGSPSSGTERWDHANSIGVQMNTLAIASAGATATITETLSAGDNVASGAVFVREAGVAVPKSYVVDGTAGGQATGTGNFSVVMRNPTAGSTDVILALNTNSANTISGVSGLGATWTKLGSVANASSDSTELWLGAGASSGQTTITVSRSGGVWGYSAIEVAGLALTSKQDGSAVTNSGTSTTPASGNITPTDSAGGIVVVALGWSSTSSSPTVDVGSPFDPGQWFRQTTPNIYLAYGFQSSPSTTSAGVTISASSAWAAVTAALRNALVVADRSTLHTQPAAAAVQRAALR